jgi:hypothetical protein
MKEFCQVLRMNGRFVGNISEQWMTAFGRYRPDQTLGLAKRSAVDQLLSVPQTTGTLGWFIYHLRLAAIVAIGHSRD